MKISIVGGAGRVGLPLAIVLAERKFKVKIVDLDQNKVSLINSRVMPFNEVGAQDLLNNLSEKDLIAHTELKYISGTDACILIVGTPVSKEGKPSASTILMLIKEMIPYFQGVKILILRSTVFPGVTKNIKDFLFENNLNIEVAFCPERLVEGNAIQELLSLPQIIGVETDKAYDLANEIFKVVSPQILRTTTEEAEITKLFANSFRYLQFGIANEFFKICVANNLDWEKVWHAIKYNYPRTSALPNPGFAAGPCLVKDTQQLNYYYSNNFKLGNSVLEVNESLPDFLVGKLMEVIDIKDKSIGILGMTFKGQIDDFRQSLSFRLKRLLESRAKKVLCSDTHAQKNYFVDTDNLLKQSDIIIIATPHHEYKKIVTSKPIIDIWRITSNKSLI
jgi:UDP-N-acetyl-D-mannosaminuronic acid dehydrogenase